MKKLDYYAGGIFMTILGTDIENIFWATVVVFLGFTYLCLGKREED